MLRSTWATSLLLVCSSILNCASITVVSSRFEHSTNKHTGAPIAKHTYWLDIRNSVGNFAHTLNLNTVRVSQNGQDLGGEATKYFKKVSEATIHLALDVSGSMSREETVQDLIDSVSTFLSSTAGKMARAKYVFYLFSSEYAPLKVEENGSLALAQSCADATIFDASTMPTKAELGTIIRQRVVESDENSQYTNLYGTIKLQARCADEMARLRKTSGPSIIVVFTDGMDNISEATVGEIAFSKETLPPIISVGLGSVDKKDLLKISQKGMFFYAKEVKELRQAFSRLALNIAFLWQYDFYPPTGKEAVPVHLELKVSWAESAQIDLTYSALDKRILAARMACVRLLKSTVVCNSHTLDYPEVYRCMNSAAVAGNPLRAENCMSCAAAHVQTGQDGVQQTKITSSSMSSCLNKKLKELARAVPSGEVSAIMYRLNRELQALRTLKQHRIKAYHSETNSHKKKQIRKELKQIEINIDDKIKMIKNQGG